MLGARPLGLGLLGSGAMTKSPRTDRRPSGPSSAGETSERRAPPEPRGFESDAGVTVLVTASDEPPGEPMVLMSASLLRRLLAAARSMGPRRRKARAPPRRKLDIRV